MNRSLFFVAMACLAAGFSSVCFAQDRSTGDLNKLSPEEWQSRVNAARERLEKRREELRLEREKRLGPKQEKLKLNREERIEPKRDELRRERENKGGELPSPPQAGSTIDPTRFGLPTADTAGVPAGVTLTNYSGPMTITRPGAVIENVIINGTLSVKAANVTIKNCIIQNFGWWGIEGEGAANLRIENCDIIGPGAKAASNSAILGSGTFVGNDIRGVTIGIQTTDGASTIRDNYIHDLASGVADPHYDGITVLGRQNQVVIEHNTISVPNDHGTAAVFIKNDFGPIDDVVVRNNLMYGDPSYAMYVAAITPNGTITNVVIENNYIERGAYGYIAVENSKPIIRNNVEWNNHVDPIPYPR
ncbi:right-handed parallel beta-helix repeat-containing protein [Bradyrhizobium retamae]|nr:right-handed parallel beta-helix repeat-containing protein [Bradyrhizobium retamae]